MSKSEKSCKGCPKLVAIPEDQRLPEERNFWNTCPRKLAHFPSTPCSMGKSEQNERGKTLREAPCPWGINSEAHDYCFWKYIHQRSTPQGLMDPLLQSDVAKLLGCSSTKIHFETRDALNKLKEAHKFDELRELCSSLEGEDTAALSVPDTSPFDSDPESGSFE